MKWNSDRSLHLSVWCTRLAMLCVAACGVMTPRLVSCYILLSHKPQALALPLMTSILACCLPAAAALLWLHRLLLNIRAERVFIAENVALLRRISWCCFIASAILCTAARASLLFLLLSAAAAFMGLILRVVKNVIHQAAIIKAENELTI